MYFTIISDTVTFSQFFRYSYVDTYRMMAVNLGSDNADLKQMMAKAGSKIKTDEKGAPGEPNLILYLKLADHLLRKRNFEAALANVAEAAEYSPDSPLVMLAAAKIHQQQGQWEQALQAAEFVLEQDPKNTKAILIKAEGKQTFTTMIYTHLRSVFL